jgi:rhodanese-related sulfurtransferase
MRRLVTLSLSAAVLPLALVALILALASPPPATGGPATLDATISDVARRWPEIGHITPAALDRMMAKRNAIVFDVRTPQEYAVSHLPGAIHVAPGMRARDFLERYGGKVKGKAAVFYCSVGVRSSRMAEKVADGLKARGATAVDDLAGGIFAWHGERRALVDAKGSTDFVHPYDASWGRLLARPELARTTPRG